MYNLPTKSKKQNLIRNLTHPSINHTKNYILPPGLRTGYQALKVNRMRERGVNVVLSTDDVTTDEGARKLIESSNTDAAPLGGKLDVHFFSDLENFKFE